MENRRCSSPRERYIWRKLRAHYRQGNDRPLPRRNGNTLIFKPSGYCWRTVVTLHRHRCYGKTTPPFRDPHPALGWPLVRFSSRNADEGFMETSSTYEYQDPEGWFTLVEHRVEEAWWDGEYLGYAEKVKAHRTRKEST